MYTVKNLCIKFNIKVYKVIYMYSIYNSIYAIINFNMHRSVDKTEYFLESKSLKLVNHISNQLNHQYYFIFY